SGFDDHLIGGDGNDILGSSAGSDTLDGGEGDDYFDLAATAGSVDGGDGTDTVHSNDLGSIAFADVEILDVTGTGLLAPPEVVGTIAQLNAFATIRETGHPGVSLGVSLVGVGGAIDFSTRITGGYSVSVDGSGLTSGAVVTGSGANDSLTGSGFDDTLSG